MAGLAAVILLIILIHRAVPPDAAVGGRGTAAPVPPRRIGIPHTSDSLRTNNAGKRSLDQQQAAIDTRTNTVPKPGRTGRRCPRGGDRGAATPANGEACCGQRRLHPSHRRGEPPAK